MSERTHALRQLREYIKRRVKSWQDWTPSDHATDEMIDDHCLAVKVRRDECREFISEIDRMLDMKPSGRKKKET